MESFLDQSLANLDPQVGGDYVFVSTDTVPPGLEPFAVIREAEGVTLVVPAIEATQYGFGGQPLFTLITMGAVTSLTSVGVTATVAQTIASRNIACNVVAGYYHDHLLVPKEDSVEVVGILRHLSRQAEGWLPQGEDRG